MAYSVPVIIQAGIHAGCLNEVPKLVACKYSAVSPRLAKRPKRRGASNVLQATTFVITDVQVILTKRKFQKPLHYFLELFQPAKKD